MKALLNSVGFAISLLLMAATVFIHLAPRLGWRVENIRSNSMAPELQRGTLVVAQVTPPETVAVGDIIIFRPVTVGENLICHRVTSIATASPRQFQTKGDADAAPDPFIVPARHLVGRISLYLPRVGYVVQFLKTPLGLLLTVVMPGLVMLEMCLGGIRRELTRKTGETRDEVAGNEE